MNTTKKPTDSILTPEGWTWQDEHAFVQGRVVPAGARTIYVAGQASVDPKGKVLHAGDMGAQIVQCFANLETVLAEAGATLANVVRVMYLTPHMKAFFAVEQVLNHYLLERNCYPTSVLLGVQTLADPDFMFEVEAIAVV
ncbi:RidA family protein [Paraburkholderia pallida]|nr:RidA family protein [Paraburkholderia pallida]